MEIQNPRVSAGCPAPSSTGSMTRASKHKKESQNNRTPEENARGKKTQTTACVRRVKIPLHRSAPVQREKVVRYREIPCRVPEYRQPQPEAKANQKWP